MHYNYPFRKHTHTTLEFSKWISVAESVAQSSILSERRSRKIILKVCGVVFDEPYVGVAICKTVAAQLQIIESLFSGHQLRKSEQNGFHDNFLISQPNPMM